MSRLVIVNRKNIMSARGADKRLIYINARVGSRCYNDGDWFSYQTMDYDSNNSNYEMYTSSIYCLLKNE